MAVLIGMSGALKGKTFQLDKETTTLGRNKDNTIIVDNPAVSGTHCAVVRDGEHFVLKDLRSTNGTRLNSRPATDERLRPKDLIQIGAIELMFDGVPVSGTTDHALEMSHRNMATTEVQITEGETAAPDSFESISPFGARKREKKGLWVILLILCAGLAFAGVIAFFIALSGVE